MRIGKTLSGKPMISRDARILGKRMLHQLFLAAQRLGINLLPNHFYSSIPDIRYLRQNVRWRAPMAMDEVAGHSIDQQLAVLESWCGQSIRDDLADHSLYREAVQQNGQGGGYGPIEAELLHAFVRTNRPERIIQLGCGVSTAVILRAALAARYTPKLTCIEPLPSAFLRDAAKRGDIALVEQLGQDVGVEQFSELGAGDLLFVDSTHTVMAGSEVNHVILNVLPRLRGGVHVHFHDITFPYDYGRHILSSDLFFWSESTLLHAFLISNQRYRLSISQSMLHYSARDELKAVHRNYVPQDDQDGLAGSSGGHFPSSTWIKSEPVGNQ